MPAGKGKKGGKGKKAVAAATSPLADSVLRHLPPEVLGEIAFHLHGFKASDKFAGARAGRVFKMGDLGLGYYVDDGQPTSTALLPLAATCTEMRAAVLPVLLPIAKLVLRLAREEAVRLQTLSASWHNGYGYSDEIAAVSTLAARRLVRAGKFAKLCGLKESAEELQRVLLPTGDGTRDQCRLKLKECFEKGIATNIKMLHEFDSNPAGMANECEHEMFEKLCGGSLPVSKDYKARFRSLMFNLKDEKNPDFILSVVMGAVHVNDLATMDVKEMASSEAKKQREKWRENAKMALMDEKSYNNYTGKVAQDGILRCPKCKSWKTEYFEVQTRSADEPTTKKCFCNSVRRHPPPATRRRAPPPAARGPPPTAHV